MSASLAEHVETAPETTTAKPAKDLTHTWVAAVELPLDEARARYANFRQSFKTRADERVRIDVLDVYCKGCRRTMDQAGDQPCAAKIDNTHLIGGNPGERAKRKHYAPPGTVTAIPAPRINRRGIDAVLSGEA